MGYLSTGSPTLQRGGENQKWPSSGQIGYMTSAVRWSPRPSERGRKPEAANKWADWLHNPYRLGSTMLWSGGQNQQLPTSGQIGYITPTVWGPQCFGVGDKTSNCPQMGRLAT